MSQLTEQQQAVVDQAVGNILVSAAAGSGKTRVLTDRIVKRIVSGESDVRSILVMTFTDMAARQMREKIAEKLRLALVEATDGPTIDRLRRQLLLLPGAHVSTIHAFCLAVIHDFYHEARDESGQPLVSPDFMIDDGAESDILLDESIESLLQECHEAIDLAEGDLSKLALPEELAGHLPMDLTGQAYVDAFYRLVDGYGGVRNETSLKELMLSLYRFLRSMPDYTAFVREKLEVYKQDAVCFSKSNAAKVLVGQLKLRLDRAMTVLDELDSQLGFVRFYVDRNKNEEMTARYRETFSILRSLDEGIKAGQFDYDAIYRLSRPLFDIAAPRGNRSDTPEKKAFMALFYTYVAEAIYTAAGGAGQKKCLDAFQFEKLIAFERPSDVIEAELVSMQPSVHCLMALVLAVDTRYAMHKRQAGIIDFGDFEHLALTILRSPEAGTYYRLRIKEVYIDEYQDTSSIQEAIIASITDRNCLMVGDVKQSIYRFRHARPQIFLDKHEAYATGRDGVLFELNRNFRSQAGIIDTVNSFFTQLMSESAGEIRYDERHTLMAGAEPAADPRPAVRLLFLDETGSTAERQEEDISTEAAAEAALERSDSDQMDPDEPSLDSEDESDESGLSIADLNRYQREALMVAGEIGRLQTEGVAFRDIAILARTRQILKQYASVFTEQGIPLLEEADQAFLDTPTLRLMEALIHVLDNRLQDIPLAAVMRSAFFAGGFTDDEMARIRLEARNAGLSKAAYHEAVDWYARSGQVAALSERIASFLVFLDQLRDKEPLLSIGELLDLAFEETSFRDRLARQPDGADQVADLDRFKAFAERFEIKRRKGVYAFARQIERLHERNKEQPPLPGDQANANAIRLLTMHRSKGLEFPVVFMVGTASPLRLREKNERLLLSEQLGIGLDFVDPKRQVLYPTPLKQAMFEAMKARNRSEELRLMYVAMTRAQRSLYVTGIFKVTAEGDAAAIRLIKAARAVTRAELPEHMVLSARSFQDWILMAIARNRQVDLKPVYGETDEDEIQAPLADGVSIPVTWCRPSQTEQALSQQSDPKQAEPDEPKAQARFSSALLLTQPLPAGLVEPELPPHEADEMIQHIDQVILGDYPFTASVRLPQKMTVSELKRRADKIEALDREDGQANRLEGITTAVLDWTESTVESMTASDIGTAVHQAFRFLDLAELITDSSKPTLLKALDHLEQQQVLTKQERAALSPMLDAIGAFFASPIAKRLHQASQSGRVYREMPFTIAVPAAELFPEAAGAVLSDRILVQGMIDLWFREESSAVLIDFKTDRISGNAQERAETMRKRYQVQIDTYASAIRKATGLEVRERLIYAVQDGRFMLFPAPEAGELDKYTTG